VLPEGRIFSISRAVTAETDESRLVGMARDGDRSAFERLYREHVGRVYGLCLRLTGNVAEAEDMVQETFVRAWRKLHSFEGRSKLSSWLHRLAVNVVLNARRARGRLPAWEAWGDHPDPYDAASPAPAHGERADLEEAVTALPDAARMVFVLYAVYGHTHEEIAEMTGTAVGTSKANLHRARKLLKEALGS
jgi:RNA polymerase sigma-70 factor (ECF subfamily)